MAQMCYHISCLGIPCSLCQNTIKVQKIWTVEKSCKYPKNLTVRFYRTVMGPEDADGMANSVDPDQTAQEQSDLGLHCLPRPVCLNTKDHYGNVC